MIALPLRYTSGNRYAPSSPVGECVVEVDVDGALRVEARRGEERRMWAAHLGPAEVEQLREAIAAAGPPPPLPARVAPGASLASIEHGSTGEVLKLELFSARKVPGWAALLHLFDSLLLAGSGGAVRLGVGHVAIAVSGLRSADRLGPA